MATTYHYYLIIQRTNGPGPIGPFKDEQERDDFACAVWFGQPARMPYAERGSRVPFDKDAEQLYYTAVDLGNARLMSFRNVTVGDLMKGRSFPHNERKKKTAVVSSCVALLLLVAASAHAQTRHAPATADVYAMLKQHEFHAPVELPRAPLVASTHATGASVGPWTFPVQPVVYAQPWILRAYASRSGFGRSTTRRGRR